MSTVIESPVMDEHNELDSLNQEYSLLLAEAQQVWSEVSGEPPNSANNTESVNNTEPGTETEPPPPTGTAEQVDATDDNNSDVIEIVQEIPVVDLLDATTDFVPENLQSNNPAPVQAELSQDDDIIFVQQIRNDNPVTIDLCSDSFVGILHSTPNPRRRRHRATSDLGAVVVDTDEIPTRRPRFESHLLAQVTAAAASNDSQNASTMNSSAPIKCAICLESAIKRQPVSTFCGHVFCKSCIEQASD